MADPNLELEFLKFQAVADAGYQLVNKKYAAIQAILQKDERRIKIDSAKPNQDNQTSALLTKQSQEIQDLQEKISVIKRNIDDLRESAKEFSIAIYGRNLAGKSTLMEISTHGNGKTIGKGAKRPKTEIRSYHWNGLKITDVSSVEAENIFRTADLILFLMAHNTPQAEDAECFVRLKNFGKPIIGVINVRRILNFKQRDLILKELKKILPNSKEVETAITNFKNFAAEYNQDWSNIKFLPAHFLAAYYARLDKVNDEEIYNASNFVEVENFVLGKVITDGEFLHIKNFVDSVAVPMCDIVLKLFEHSANSLKESKIWENNSDEISAWRKNFIGISQRKISTTFNKVSENLKKEIANFVDKNSNDSNIYERWNNRLQELNYAEDFQNALKEISGECTERIQEAMNVWILELTNSLGGKTQTNLEVEDAGHFKEYYAVELPNFSTLLPKSEPVTVRQNDAGTLFYETFFDKSAAPNTNKESQIKKLSDSSLKIFNEIEDAARKTLNSQIIPKIDEFSKMLAGYSRMLAQLGEFQSELAENLLAEYEELNSELFKAAVKNKISGDVSGVKVTMRVPGESFSVIADNFEVDEAAISEILGEKFSVVNSLKSWNSTMKKILDCDFELEEYSLDFKTGDKTYSVVPKEKLSPAKLNLAQQASPYPIINN